MHEPSARSVREGDLLWTPSEHLRKTSRMASFMAWLKDRKAVDIKDYQELWEWSVSNIPTFWESIWEFFEIQASRPYTEILRGSMPNTRWFIGSELNYAEHVFRGASPDRPALLSCSETRDLTPVSWKELEQKVASVAASLREMGVRKGDRVVAYLPNIPETIIAFLAAASIGATWSSCSPDFGTRSVVDRFQQIRPKVLFAVDGYAYAGKSFDRLPEVMRLKGALSDLERVVIVPSGSGHGEGSLPAGLSNALLWSDLLGREQELVFEQVPFDHPLWVVYSSGTTGLPKGLVHGHGGILLEFYKFSGLHLDLRPGDNFFWFSTTGWVMWNILQGGLLLGATPVLYDGSPGYPDMHRLWQLAEQAPVHIFGTSAAYITACMSAGLKPVRNHDLHALRTVGSTGSPLSPEGFKWVYEEVKRDVWLASVSGGTDPCTAFLGGCPLLPVHAGELQCRCLGVKADAYDDAGRSVVGEVGELVITEPMPSMPLHLWNDPDNQRYLESYFETYPGVWRHGDWIRITPKGSAVILGRSDSTLKRQGVRMGSSEIYGALEDMPEILDTLVVGYEREGVYHMPLFVVLREGSAMTEALKDRIRTRIRTALSPRHLPDDILVVPEIPKTLNGKKLEVPVKKILMGMPVDKAVNVDSMSNPRAMDYFVNMVERVGQKTVRADH